MSDNTGTGILAGVRVIEVATLVFGPAASVVLADFGADVIKVEPVNGGDLNRDYHKLPGMPVSDLAYTFQMDNRNKKSIALDLKSSAGQIAIHKLIAQADVFVTNYRCNALIRLKLDSPTLRAINSRLIYALGTGYGEAGDECDQPGYDNVCYWSRSAIEPHVFPVEGWLGIFPFGAGDHPSGMSLFAAIMLGLYQRQNSGEGAKVSTSLLANGAWANATMLQAQLCHAEFQGKRPRAQAYNFTSLHYRSKDNRLLKLGIVNTEKDWPSFCRAMTRPELIEDVRFALEDERHRNMELLIGLIDEAFAEQDMAYWQRSFERQDIPFAVLPSYAEAADDPQKAANGIVVPLQHTRFGSIGTISSPIEVSDHSKTTPTTAPELGEHSREILTEIGYSAKQIQRLLDDGVTREL